MRKAPTNRARSFFAPLIAFLLVALSLVFVGVASPASAFNDCGKDPGWTKVDNDSGTVVGDFGSLTFDANGENPTTIFYVVNEGFTLELCIKASTSDFYSAPIVGAATGSFSTGEKNGISHIGYKVTETLPECPGGDMNGDEPGCDAPEPECPGGDMNGDEPGCDAPEVGGEQLEIPAEPGMKDPCGVGNAKWVVPADTNELDWTLTDGVLSVEITATDTVFDGTQDTTYSFGKAVETNKEACETQGEEGNNPPEQSNNPLVTAEVKGEQAAVPSAVDAGLGAANSPIPAGRNPLWLLAAGCGFGLMGSAGLRRRSAANR